MSRAQTLAATPTPRSYTTQAPAATGPGRRPRQHMPTATPPAPAGARGAPSRETARGRLPRALAAVAGVLALTLAGASSAHAGEWVQVSCINPNQTAAGSAGWSSFAANTGYGSNNSTQCGPGAGAYALLSSAAAAPVGAHETLQYTPPAGSTLNGGLLDLRMQANGHGYNASGTAIAYTPEYAYNASNVIFQCAAGLAPCGNLSNEYIGQLTIPAARGGNLYLEAGCGGNSGYSCTEGATEGAWSQLQLWWANLRLTNNATPAATNIAGTLLTPAARETRELLLTATDPAGPGVHSITVQADGQTLYTGTPDTNGGQCTAVGESGGALMFDSSQPCKQSENVDLQIATTALHDGQHTLKVTVTDAAANSSVVYDNTISTHNAPENTAPPTLTGTPELNETLIAGHGEWSAPAATGTTTYSYQWQQCNSDGSECEPIPGAEGATHTTTSSDVGHTLRVLVTATDADGAAILQTNHSAVINAPAATAATSLPSPAETAGILGTAAPATPPNGTPASDDARLHLRGPAHITRSYQQRALTITGTLTTPTGQPIRGASLQAGEQNGQVLAEPTSTSAGTFTIHLPPGPSRTITIGYRAHTGDPSYAAQAHITETVRAGVALHITPRHTQAAGTITISGQAAGPIPRGGVLVELQVHYRGQWVPFRAPRTNSDGRFTTRYQFQGATGRYPFRAQIPAGQAGYPYSAGTSNTDEIQSG